MFTSLPVLGGKNHKIAGFELRSQDGQFASIRTWNNKIVVADFFFTHCPVVCPKMTNSLKKVRERFHPDKDLLIISFTVDPERDSVERLQQYAAQMNIQDNWLLLTGDKKQIYQLARKSFLVTATEGDGGAQDFIHSDQLVLVDKQKRIRGFYNGTVPEQVELLIRDISRLKNEEE